MRCEKFFRSAGFIIERVVTFVLLRLFLNSVSDFDPADLSFTGQFNFQEFSHLTQVLSMIQHRFPITVVAGTAVIFVSVGRNVLPGLTIIRNRKLQVCPITGEECENPKTFDGSW